MANGPTPMTPYLHTDPASLLRELNGDLVAFRALSATYLRIAPPLLAKLEQALCAADGAALARAAHALRGAATLMGSTALVLLLRRFEQGAAAGDLPGAADLADLRHLFEAAAGEVGHSAVHFVPA